MKIEAGQTGSIGGLTKKPVSEEQTPAKTVKTESPSAVLNLSDATRQIHEKIKNLDSYEEVRDDVVAEAQNDIKQWDSLTEGQIDQIFDNILEEMAL